MPADAETIKLPGTPKPWVNSIVATCLRTPGLRSVLGRTLMLLTVTGASTGTRYTIPVQYVRDGGQLIVLSQRTRRWWQNLSERPEVKMLIRGATITGVAQLATGDEARDPIATALRLDPRTARFHGVAIDDRGEPDPHGLDQLCAALVAIVIDPVN